MTNTLHRFGDAQSFRDDFIVFAIASRGKNDEDSVPKLRRFLEIAMQFKPVNLGDSRHGGAYRPSRSMSPLAHWNRDNEPDFQKVIDGFDTTATAAAVFDNLEAAEQCTKAVREADLGLSVTAPDIRWDSKARPNTSRTAMCWRCRRCADTAWSACRSRRR